MRRLGRTATLWIIAFLLATGCAGPASTVTSDGEQPRAAPAAPKRLKIAIKSDPATVTDKVGGGQAKVQGVAEMENLLNDGMTEEDDRRRLRGQLAELVPTVENGLWKVFTDGRMETTWRIRPGAAWHDGTPFTAEDVLFTAAVDRDKDLPVLRSIAYDFIERIEAVDTQTVVVHWRRPYIEADAMFTQPVPKHVLEMTYLENRAAFIDHPYWHEGFIGTGPFKLVRFARGSHAIMQANQQYPLGRPRIDELEVRFIPDEGTLMASILAGEVELTLERSLSLDQAIEVRDQWRDGGIVVASENWFLMFPQLLPGRANPPAMIDVRFRRALLHAIDRLEMMNAMEGGLSSVAHSYVHPNTAEFKEVEASIVKYEYDPRRAMQLIEELGYAKGADGFYRDSATQRLAVEVRTITVDLNQKALFAVADGWQRVGVATDTVIIPQQRAQDREYRAGYPGFMLERQPDRVNDVDRYHSSQTPLVENRFSGTWRPGYKHPEMDGLIERFVTTIPLQERMDVLRQLVAHMTDQVVMMGLFYDVTPTMIANRLKNVSPARGGASQSWNAHEWELR